MSIGKKKIGKIAILFASVLCKMSCALYFNSKFLRIFCLFKS